MQRRRIVWKEGVTKKESNSRIGIVVNEKRPRRDPDIREKRWKIGGIRG